MCSSESKYRLQYVITATREVGLSQLIICEATLFSIMYCMYTVSISFFLLREKLVTIYSLPRAVMFVKVYRNLERQYIILTHR